MSKHWNPDKPTVELRASRIRREPVTLVKPKVATATREQEIRGGVIGVLAIAGALTAAVIGISAVTLFKTDPAAAAADTRFGQCYNGGTNCVVDGGTIYVRGNKLAIAGIYAPQIQDARCDAERSKGIDASIMLAGLLNGGTVMVGPTFTDDFGRSVRSVSVRGKDVGKAMIDAGAARKADPERKLKGWC
jgi:micrococcal nuclease